MKNRGIICIPDWTMKKIDWLLRNTESNSLSDIINDLESYLNCNGKVNFIAGFYPASKIKFVGLEIKLFKKELFEKVEKRYEEIKFSLQDFIQTDSLSNPWDENFLLVKVEKGNIRIFVDEKNFSTRMGGILSLQYIPEDDFGIPMFEVSLGMLIHIVSSILILDFPK